MIQETITPLKLVTEFKSSELNTLKRFCFDYMQPEKIINGLLILSDIEVFPEKCYIATYKEDKNDLSAILLRYKLYYIPLGLKEQALQLLESQMDLNQYFAHIPKSWQSSFEERIQFSDKLENIIFSFTDKADFRIIAPPKELRVRIVQTEKDATAAAEYYEKEPKEIINSMKTLPIAIGMLEDRIVSVARANAVALEYALLGGVHTLKEFRKKGYSKAVCSGWTKEVLSRGLTPVLDTDVDNQPALKVYRAIGYSEIGNRAFYSKGTDIIERLRSRE